MYIFVICIKNGNVYVFNLIIHATLSLSRPNQIIVGDIRHGNSESFGAEPLRELLKLLPEKDEVKQKDVRTSEVQTTKQVVKVKHAASSVWSHEGGEAESVPR